MKHNIDSFQQVVFNVPILYLMADKTEPTAPPQQTQLVSLEDDDEFEEFTAGMSTFYSVSFQFFTDFSASSSTGIEATEWQNEWDEENPDDAFLVQLRQLAEKEKATS